MVTGGNSLVMVIGCYGYSYWLWWVGGRVGNSTDGSWGWWIWPWYGTAMARADLADPYHISPKVNSKVVCYPAIAFIPPWPAWVNPFNLHLYLIFIYIFIIFINMRITFFNTPKYYGHFPSIPAASPQSDYMGICCGIWPWILAQLSSRLWNAASNARWQIQIPSVTHIWWKLQDALIWAWKDIRWDLQSHSCMSKHPTVSPCWASWY